jgi:cytidylate kinase
VSETTKRQGRLVIAIDGPSGAGKGTIARAIAQRLGYRHVDTGAMYRAVAWLALERGIALDAEAAVGDLAAGADLQMGGGRIVIDGHDVTERIRTPEMDSAAAAVARNTAVRHALVNRQRDMGVGGGIVMEWRVIGTVVFPAADVKIYLEAYPEDGAGRRAADPAHSGGRSGLSAIATAMADRDRLDSTRTTSPLAAAAEAIRIDTTGRTIEDCLDELLGELTREGWLRGESGADGQTG